MLQTLTAWSGSPRFNDVLRPGFRAWTPGLLSDISSPVASFYEDAERIVVTLDVPGIQAADMDIEIEPHSLAIRATRRRGESSRSYNQRWTLHSTVDAENAHAHLEDGVLTVVLPKVTPRKVEIRVASGSAGANPGPLERFRSWVRGLFSSNA